MCLTDCIIQGALFLVLGDSMPSPARDLYEWGLQVPDPIELVNFRVQTADSIWHPTTITQWVSIVLIGFALVSLLHQALAMARSERALCVLEQTGSGQPDDRVTRLLAQAATVMRLPMANLPPVLLVELPCPTPLLIGVRSARVLLSPCLAATLNDAELELAFRHELAHYQRRDHWWRWLLLWVESIGRPILLSGILSAAAVTAEEELCDRQAVLTPRDAAILAQAIRHSTSDKPAAQADSLTTIPPLPGFVVPSLLGQDVPRRYAPRTLVPRLSHLLALAQERRSEASHLVMTSAPISSSCRIASSRAGWWSPIARIICFGLRLLFGLALILVLYMKYHLFLNVR